MKKDTPLYSLKKNIGVVVIRIFEWLVHLTIEDKAFFEASDFPFTKVLELHADKIREEYLQIAETTTIPKIEEVFVEQDKITGDDNWRSFLLTIYGNDLVEHLDRCPVTQQAINQVPRLTSAMFSVLAPNKSIPPHRGPYKGVLRCHLALVVPDEERCTMVVNGIEKHWQQGKCMVFDDTFVHAAYNTSNRPRTVLFIDFIRPLPFPLNYLNAFLFKLLAKSEFIQEILERSENLDNSTIRERKISLI